MALPDRTVIRRPRPEDAPKLGAVHVASWRETYEGILSDAFLAGMSVNERVGMWQDVIGRPNRSFLAEVDGRIVGFALAGESREDEAPRETQLHAMYLLSDYYGTGIGVALLDAAISDAPAFLWVAADNHRALSFYRKHGFVVDGITKTEPAWEDLRALRMTR
ncbi:GNAT family N-acetyltransferase [Planctomonas psychrotolerans]|uniref:GNAT family N-acetyltransferase n=1 Tax=Planctomonas psychrotolerans TaxID=2528712 RepID=UPI00123A85E4|nr:GNAT family N-acetyltransferase [Planctomonas psychrotolerans]